MDRYKAGAEKPICAKLRILGIPEPQLMSKSRVRGDNSWVWVPFTKLRYADKRNMWSEFNRQAEILLRVHAENNR